MRNFLRWVSTAIVAFFVVPLGSEFFVEWAKEQGVYANPAAKVSAAMSWTSGLVENWWFALAFGGLASATVLLWTDHWLRGRKAEPKAVSLKAGLYVGDMKVATSKLATELVIEFSARGFNATGGDIRIVGLQGVIKCSSGCSNDTDISLPAPSMEDRFTQSRIGHLTEFIVAIEQRVTRDVADRILALDGDSSVWLNFQSLDILATTRERPGTPERLPLWGGMRLNKRPGAQNADRVVYATARNLLVGEDSTN